MHTKMTNNNNSEKETMTQAFPCENDQKVENTKDASEKSKMFIPKSPKYSF